MYFGNPFLASESGDGFQRYTEVELLGTACCGSIPELKASQDRYHRRPMWRSHWSLDHLPAQPSLVRTSNECLEARKVNPPIRGNTLHDGCGEAPYRRIPQNSNSPEDFIGLPFSQGPNERCIHVWGSTARGRPGFSGLGWGRGHGA